MSATLLSVGELERWLGDRAQGPVVVDARPAEDYTHGHIPGAISVNWSDWCAPAPSTAGSEMRQPGFWGALADGTGDWYAERLSARGMSNDHPVVVYADGPVSKGRDARIAWMLLYLGAGSVSLLNGGWRAWVEMGGEREHSIPALGRGKFIVEWKPERRCTQAALLHQSGAEVGPVLVDTRSRPEFEGRIHDYQPRRGHLPGAELFPFARLYQPSGKYVDRKEYQRRIPNRVRDAARVVAYCEVGVRACTFALLHEVYTGQVVAVYDGSFMEWALDPELPIQASG